MADGMQVTMALENLLKVQPVAARGKEAVAREDDWFH